MTPERLAEAKFLFETGHLHSAELGDVNERRRLAGLKLLAEVERLKPLAEIGAAVEKLPPDSALVHDAPMTCRPTHPLFLVREGRPGGWSVVDRTSETHCLPSVSAALRAAGLMGVSDAG